MVPCSVKGTPKPQQSDNYESFQVNSSTIASHKPRLQDTAWLISRYMNRLNSSEAISNIDTVDHNVNKDITQQCVPTWTAYNYLVSKIISL